MDHAALFIVTNGNVNSTNMYINLFDNQVNYNVIQNHNVKKLIRKKKRKATDNRYIHLHGLRVSYVSTSSIKGRNSLSLEEII